MVLLKGTTIEMEEEEEISEEGLKEETSEEDLKEEAEEVLEAIIIEILEILQLLLAKMIKTRKKVL